MYPPPMISSWEVLVVVFVVLVLVLVVLGVVLVVVEVVAKPLLLLRLKNHPQDHQNHHQDHQNHHQGLAPLTTSPPCVGSRPWGTVLLRTPSGF